MRQRSNTWKRWISTWVDWKKVRLKRKKCTFLADEVVYQGHKIEQHKLHPVQDKVEAIRNYCARERSGSSGHNSSGISKERNNCQRKCWRTMIRLSQYCCSATHRTTDLVQVPTHITEDDTEYPVGFASRTLNAADRNYSQLEKEGAAIMFALKKFHKRLYGRYCVIMTDHKPLFGELKQVPIMAAWRSLCVGTRKIQHGNADCLSRSPLPVTVKE